MAMIDGTALNVIIEETHEKKVYLSMKALFERSKNNHEHVFYDNANVSAT